MCTCGRHQLAERSLGLFLQQKSDWVGEGDHRVKPIYNLLIYNNSDIALKLDENTMKDVKGYKNVRLVNNHINKETGKRYTNLGAIYRDALSEFDEYEYPDIIVHWDDDDLFLENHLLEGIKGLQRGGKTAYKPAKSWYRHPGGVELMSNTLEPSIFVEYDHIKKYGYSLTTTDQHLQWVNPLVYENRIFVDKNGPATLIYNWGDTTIPTFKTSGNAGSPNNFDNYRNFSNDHGDKVLTPWAKEGLNHYYKLVR